MTGKTMRWVAVAAALWTSAVAMAEEIGIPVTIQVTDAEGKPVQTAVVRHPLEADRHRVNTETGRWTASVLYLPDGSELVFEKNKELEFEISAPGYQNTRVKYIVRKRKNLVPVILEKMDMSGEEEQTEDPVIQFGRDKPLDK